MCWRARVASQNAEAGICYRNVGNGMSPAQRPLGLRSGSAPFRPQASTSVADAINIPFERGSIRVQSAYVTGQNPSIEAVPGPLHDRWQTIVSACSQAGLQPRRLLKGELLRGCRRKP
jgi:hypothetical protein